MPQRNLYLGISYRSTREMMVFNSARNDSQSALFFSLSSLLTFLSLSFASQLSSSWEPSLRSLISSSILRSKRKSFYLHPLSTIAIVSTAAFRVQIIGRRILARQTIKSQVILFGPNFQRFLSKTYSQRDHPRTQEQAIIPLFI